MFNFLKDINQNWLPLGQPLPSDCCSSFNYLCITVWSFASIWILAYS